MNKHIFYILDINLKPIPVNFHVWSDFISNADNRRVAEDYVGHARISTVFLTTCIQNDFKTLFFETMVFGLKNNYQTQYSTWDEAVDGHQKILDTLKSISH